MAHDPANGAPQEHHSVPEMAINVHNAFELCRQALGVTQQELGAMVGVSRRTAQRMDEQRYVVRPGLHVAFVRAKEFGLSVDSVEEALRMKLSPAPKAPSAKKAENPEPKRAR